MKFLSILSLVTVWQCASLQQALAVPIEHARGNSFPSDERVRQLVKIDVQNADNDEFLMEFAKATNLNILVDATNTPDDAPLINIHQENSIINFALNFSEYRGYTTQRFAADTLLFWPQYDKTQMNRQLYEANKERWIRQLDDSMPPESTRRAALLRDYFVKNLGWDGKWEGVDLRIKVKDLPPDLRAFVLSDMNAQIAYKATHIDRPFYRLRDAYWQTAKLSIHNAFDYKKKAPSLILMLNDKRLNPPMPGAIEHPSDVSMDVGELIRRGR